MRTAHKTLTTLAVAGFVAGMALFGATGTAAAVTATDSCEGTLAGKIGQKVYVHGKSVKEIVRAAAKDKATGAQYLFIWPDKLAKDIEEAGELEVGTVPDAAKGTVEGETIGAAVAKALEGESGLGSDPEDTLAHIEAKVADACGLTLKASDYVPPATSTKPEPGATEPGGRRATGADAGDPAGASAAGPRQFSYGSGDARAPRRGYGGIPSATPGAMNLTPLQKYGMEQAPVPGSAPEFGVLGAEGAQSAPPVQNAGNADALVGSRTPKAVQLPMLLAVVALAGVASALVRTWVLRPR
ncbi:MAG: hypothetical protein ACRDSE_18265 [Pseudonocardiaceae bacterium]